MQLLAEHSDPSVLSRIFASQQKCPRCGDRLIAPEVTEFIEGGTIQHYWICDSCGEESQTSVTPPVD